MKEIRSVVKIYTDIETGKMEYDISEGLSIKEMMVATLLFIEISKIFKNKLEEERTRGGSMLGLEKYDEVLSQIGPRLKNMSPEEGMAAVRDITAKIDEFVRAIDSITKGG
jgi:hypothetical protein